MDKKEEMEFRMKWNHLFCDTITHLKDTGRIEYFSKLSEDQKMDHLLFGAQILRMNKLRAELE